ncbi:hypothetical protein P879_03118 [Paragonimus westermani]|uniref:Uncharacterized protein n=1 Tax=Paragonimus westermani TaxID=34504 RepID=A0A8T0D336_9TREM|nr:hypothetical protein P879_03118 [Paragonimus westermani]
MEENNQPQNIPLLCRKKCGFFGSPNFDGLCSKCHRSAQLAAQQADSISSLDSKLPVSDIRRSSESPTSVKSPRCDICRKRVGPAGGYSCRCEGIFCSLHRYSDAHNCSYDYRRAGQEDIRRSNPQVVCSKLPKI